MNEQFEPTLMGAVARCMELDPEGIMLSGGLDSVTIAALAAEYAATHHTPLITAVSGRRADTYTGEEPMQTATATALGMRHLVAKESEWMGARGEIELSLDIIPRAPRSVAHLLGRRHDGFLPAYRGAERPRVADRIWRRQLGVVGDAYAADTMRRLHLRQLSRFIYSYVDTGGLSFRAAARHFLWAGGLRVLLDSFTARWLPRRRLAITIAAPAPLCLSGCAPTRR